MTSQPHRSLHRPLHLEPLESRAMFSVLPAAQPMALAAPSLTEHGDASPAAMAAWPLIPATLQLGPDTVPVYGATPDWIAQESGAWTNQEIWKATPALTAAFFGESSLDVPPAVEVSIDSTAIARNIVVGGTLRLLPGAELHVGTLTVLPGGRLLGDLSAGGNAEIWIRPQAFDAADIAQWGRGIIVAGQIDLLGADAGSPSLANLGRNVRILSEDPSLPGHIVIGGDAAAAHVENIEISGMGRTTNANFNSAVGGVPGMNQIGRYALHFHHYHGPTSPLVEGSLLRGGISRWGLVIHHTNHGQFNRNTIQGFLGAGIMVESGEEHGNTIRENVVSGATGSGLAVYHRSMGRGFDVGHDGAGIWLRNGLNSVHGNTIVNCDKGIAVVQIDVGPKHDGWVDLHGTPTFINGQPIDVADNATSGNRVGVFLWEVGARITGGNKAAVAGEGPYQLLRHRSTNDRTAVELRWTSDVEIVDLVAVGDGNPKSIGVESNGNSGKTMNRNLRIVNAAISGFAVGVQVPTRGGLPGETASLIIQGGILRNAVNVEIVGRQQRTVAIVGCDIFQGVGVKYVPAKKPLATGVVEQIFADGRELWRNGDPAMPADAVVEAWLVGGMAEAEAATP